MLFSKKMNIFEIFYTQLSIKIYTNTHRIALYFMFIHRENTMKRPSIYIMLFYTKRSQFTLYTLHFTIYTLKNNFNAKSNQNIHQDVPNCTLFQNFLAGEHAP